MIYFRPGDNYLMLVLLFAGDDNFWRLLTLIALRNHRLGLWREANLDE